MPVFCDELHHVLTLLGDLYEIEGNWQRASTKNDLETSWLKIMTRKMEISLWNVLALSVYTKMIWMCTLIILPSETRCSSWMGSVTRIWEGTSNVHHTATRRGDWLQLWMLCSVYRMRCKRVARIMLYLVLCKCTRLRVTSMDLTAVCICC